MEKLLHSKIKCFDFVNQRISRDHVRKQRFNGFGVSVEMYKIENRFEAIAPMLRTMIENSGNCKTDYKWCNSE